jgi:hypothetical protein
MRRACFFPLIFLAFFISISYGAFPPQRWTSYAEISHGSRSVRCPTIHALGEKLILLWSDNRLGGYDLFYRISPDWGVSWAEEERLTTSETDSVNPHLAGDMRYLYLVWEERIGEGMILFSRFDGDSWSDPIRISPQSSPASDPRIAVMISRPSPQLFVFWTTKRGERPVVVYSTSGDDGRSWSFPRAVEESELPQMSPDAASGVTSVYLTWIEGGQGEKIVRFKRLGNPASERVMNITPPGFNSNPCLSVWEPHILLSWQSSFSPDDPSQVVISESADFGDSWDKPEHLTEGYVESVLPHPVLTPGQIWVFWQSGGEKGWRIKGVVRGVQERGWTELGMLSSGEGEAEVGPVAIATPAPEIFQIHLVWVRILRAERSLLLYRRYDTLPPEPPGKPVHFDFTALERFDDDEELSFRWTEEDKTAISFDLFLSKDGGDFLPVGSTDDRFASVKVESGHIYRLKVRAKDSSGNLSEPSPSSDPIFVDSIPPYVRISLPYPGTKLFGKVPVYVTCRDDNLSECTLYWGEGRTPAVWHPIFSSREEIEGGFAEWDTSGLFGLYTLKLEAKDEVGHVSTWTVSLEVDNIPPLDIKPGLIERPLPSDLTASFRDPSWSPDGRSVAYASNESGVWDIWILDIRSGERMNITNDTFIDRNPSWSPDGGYLVYQSFQNGNWDLWTVELGSGDKLRLTDLPSDELDPAWFPIGERIALASNIDGDFEIYLMSVKGGPIERVTDDVWDERNPIWHPSGLFLAYQSNRRGEWDIVQRLMAPGGGEEELTSTAADETDLAWSRDGKRILFTGSGPEGIKGLFSLDLITGAISRISPREIEVSDGTWASDGKAVVCQGDRGILIIRFDFPMPDLEARITSPYLGDVVSGRVEIFGVARGKLFESYLLERSASDGKWVQVEGIATEPVEEEGFLGMWDVSKLEGEYTLRLTVFGSDGSSVEDSVRVLVRNEPPKLTVIQPADGTIWNDRMIDVICQADPGSEVFVNGSRALQNGSTFIGKAWLVEGWNEISIRAVDPFERPVEFKTHVLLDTTPPELEIISPGDFELVKDPFVIVKGKLSEEGQVYINSVPLPPVRGGEEFSYAVSLEEGTNEITIAVTDRAGRSTYARRRVIYRKPQVILRDETPPVAVDPFPPDGTILSSREVELSLRLVDNVGLDPESLEVWFDDERLDEEDYSFREDRLSYRVAELTDGEHSLKLSVSDISGNRLEGYTVRFFVDTTPALAAVWAELDHDRLRISTTTIGPIERLSFIKVLQGELGYGYTVSLNGDGKGELVLVPSQRSFRLLGLAFLRDNTAVPVEGYFAYENLSRERQTRISVEMGPELVLPPGDPKVMVVLRSQAVDPSLMSLQHDNAASRELRAIGPVCQIFSSRDLSGVNMELSFPLPRNVRKGAIFRWDEKGGTWIPLDAEFDPESGRLRASLFISGPSSDLGRYALLADETPPFINVVSPPDGGEVPPDDFLVTAEVWDNGSGIADVKVEVDGRVKPAKFNPRESRLIYLPSDLDEGIHTITITALDRAGNSATSESRFFVGELFDFAADPIVYPNPSRREAFIRFMLTRSSDVTLRIYTPAGDLLFTDRKTGVAEGEFRWDHRNQAGRKVTPGVYLFAIEAQNDGRKLVRSGKLAVSGD